MEILESVNRFCSGGVGGSSEEVEEKWSKWEEEYFRKLVLLL